MKNVILKSISVSFLFVIVFFACKKEEPIHPTSVKGEVVDFKTGKPVPGAEVRLFKYSKEDFEYHDKFDISSI